MSLNNKQTILVPSYRFFCTSCFGYESNNALLFQIYAKSLLQPNPTHQSWFFLASFLLKCNCLIPLHPSLTSDILYIRLISFTKKYTHFLYILRNTVIIILCRLWTIIYMLNHVWSDHRHSDYLMHSEFLNSKSYLVTRSVW